MNGIIKNNLCGLRVVDPSNVFVGKVSEVNGAIKLDKNKIISKKKLLFRLFLKIPNKPIIKSNKITLCSILNGT